jgi:hypothetical protein
MWRLFHLLNLPREGDPARDIIMSTETMGLDDRKNPEDVQ